MVLAENQKTTNLLNYTLYTQRQKLSTANFLSIFFKVQFRNVTKPYKKVYYKGIRSVLSAKQLFQYVEGIYLEDSLVIAIHFEKLRKLMTLTQNWNITCFFSNFHFNTYTGI